MVRMRMKKLFFDTSRVRVAVDKATRRALSRTGAFIRTRAKTSIRKRKAVSKPGRPPHSHAGDLRRLIFFAYDLVVKTVVIGPLPFRDGEAPHLLEFGGNVITRKTRWIPGDTGRNVAGQFTRGKWKRVPAGTRMKYRARPFMGPAMKKEVPNLPARWRNSVKG